MDAYVKSFLRESLMIEGIQRDPTPKEIEATVWFLREPVTTDSVIALQAIYAPGKPLRDKPGMNVRVGNYLAPPGNQYMRKQLESVLNNSDPWSTHVAFEKLHPFLDGNGRTGRAVWLELMLAAKQDPFSLSFLHRFYYQTLANME